MMTTTLTIGTHEDHVAAAAAVGKTRVVSCPNPADAASPVYLHAGDYGKSLGQSADYRHHLDPLIDLHSAALVQTWWDQDAQQWYTTIDGLDDRLDDNLHQYVARRVADREAKRLAEQRAAEEAQRAAGRKEFDLARVRRIEAAKQAGEQWAPGRTAARAANDGMVIVGRWDAPNLPGYGKPAEVRRAVRGEGGSTVLVECRDSYRYCWG